MTKRDLKLKAFDLDRAGVKRKRIAEELQITIPTVRNWILEIKGERTDSPLEHTNNPEGSMSIVHDSSTTNTQL